MNQVELEKKRKYDLLANELGLMYKAKTKIIPYVMTWDGIVTCFHKSYIKEIGVLPHIEAYIQSLVLKKTLETISLEKRRGIEDDADIENQVEKGIEKMQEYSGEGQVRKNNDE